MAYPSWGMPRQRQNSYGTTPSVYPRNPNADSIGSNPVTPGIRMTPGFSDAAIRQAFNQNNPRLYTGDWQSGNYPPPEQFSVKSHATPVGPPGGPRMPVGGRLAPPPAPQSTPMSAPSAPHFNTAPFGNGGGPPVFNGPEVNPYNSPQAPHQMPASPSVNLMSNGAMSPDQANHWVDQTYGTQQRYQQAKERAMMMNSRASIPGDPGPQPGLWPTAPQYPAHPMSGKVFPTAAPQTPVQDNGMSQRAYHAAKWTGEIAADPNMKNGVTDRTYHGQQEAWREKVAKNEARDFETRKLQLQRANELRALAPRRRDMGESWIQNQYRQENPALFAHGVNSDMLKYWAAMNARQRMDAPNLGGYSPQDQNLFKMKLYFDNQKDMTPEQRIEAQRMLGIGGGYPGQHTSPPAGNSSMPWGYTQATGNPGYHLGQAVRKWLGF